MECEFYSWCSTLNNCSGGDRLRLIRDYCSKGETPDCESYHFLKKELESGEGLAQYEKESALEKEARGRVSQ